MTLHWLPVGERPRDDAWVVARFGNHGVYHYESGRYKAETDTLFIDLDEIDTSSPFLDYASWAYLE